MEFLREELRKDPDLRQMCYSGRGGEIPTEGGPWRAITRDDTKRRFRLQTEAAVAGIGRDGTGVLPLVVDEAVQAPRHPHEVHAVVSRVAAAVLGEEGSP